MNTYSKNTNDYLYSFVFIWRGLSRRRRVQVVKLFVLMVVCGIAELVSLTSVVPFLLVLTDPDRLSKIKILSPLISYIGIENRTNLLLLVTSIFIFASFFTMIVRLLSLWLNSKLAAAIGSELSVKVYSNILNKRYSWHLNNNSSSIINDITNNVAFTIGFLNSFLRIATLSIVSIFIVSGLLSINGKVAIVAFFVFLGAYLLLALSVRKRFAFNGRILVKAYQLQLKTLQEGFGAIRDVILGDYQDYFSSIYKSVDRPLRLRQAQNEFLQGSPRFILESICIVLIAIIAFFLTLANITSTEIITLLGTFALGSQKLLPTMQGIYNDWASIKTFYPGVSSILETLSADKTLKILPNSVYEKDFFLDSIKIKSLRFRHQNSNIDVLSNIDLEIFKGQKIGIVGKTGSGKSTLIDLIMGLLDPTSGEISVDGNIISSENPEFLKFWRSSISHVPQNIYLSDNSIIDNIAFGIERKNIDYSKVLRAARMANISSFIEALPDSYDTKIGERGVRLSGGQCQRIGIARALYKDAQLIIFDEATSALDSETESSVIKTIHNLSRDITLIMIAHRTSTLVNCDSVYEVTRQSLIKKILN